MFFFFICVHLYDFHVKYTCHQQQTLMSPIEIFGNCWGWIWWLEFAINLIICTHLMQPTCIVLQTYKQLTVFRSSNCEVWIGFLLRSIIGCSFISVTALFLLSTRLQLLVRLGSVTCADVLHVVMVIVLFLLICLFQHKRHVSARAITALYYTTVNTSVHKYISARVITALYYTSVHIYISARVHQCTNTVHDQCIIIYKCTSPHTSVHEYTSVQGLTV